MGYDLFRQRRFTELWSANLVLNLGLVMLMLGVSWEMTSLTSSPVLVSMVQTVMSLPFVFLSIPVGMASDRRGRELCSSDRRLGCFWSPPSWRRSP